MENHQSNEDSSDSAFSRVTFQTDQEAEKYFADHGYELLSGQSSDSGTWVQHTVDSDGNPAVVLVGRSKAGITGDLLNSDILTDAQRENMEEMLAAQYIECLNEEVANWTDGPLLQGVSDLNCALRILTTHIHENDHPQEQQVRLFSAVLQNRGIGLAIAENLIEKSSLECKVQLVLNITKEVSKALSEKEREQLIAILQGSEDDVTDAAEQV